MTRSIMAALSDNSGYCGKPLLTGPEVGSYDYPRLHSPSYRAGPANRGFFVGGTTAKGRETYCARNGVQHLSLSLLSDFLP